MFIENIVASLPNEEEETSTSFPTKYQALKEAPHEHGENQTHEESSTQEEYLDDWIELFHQGKREIDALF
jgi:hypothetical protein